MQLSISFTHPWPEMLVYHLKICQYASKCLFSLVYNLHDVAKNTIVKCLRGGMSYMSVMKMPWMHSNLAQMTPLVLSLTPTPFVPVPCLRPHCTHMPYQKKNPTCSISQVSSTRSTSPPLSNFHAQQQTTMSQETSPIKV